MQSKGAFPKRKNLDQAARSRNRREQLKPAGKKEPLHPSDKGTAPEREKFFSFLVYPVLFVFLIYPYGDYDWGWHYRYGEFLFKQGRILREDIFSWTMQGYEWVNHSWLFDPLLYVLFNQFSFFGLSIAGAIVALLAFYFAVKPFRLSYWQNAILAIAFGALMSPVLDHGLRSQVVGVLLLSYFMFVLLQAREGKTWTYLALPPLFLIWVNFHGSFLVGIILFTVFLFCDFFLLFRSRIVSIPAHWARLFASFLASTAATFINPFTYHVYVEAVRHFRDPLLTHVLEWYPVELTSPIGIYLLIYTCFLALAFIMRRRLSDGPLIASSLLLSYLAFRALRNIALYVIVTLPFAALILKEVKLPVNRWKVQPWMIIAVLALVLGFAHLRRVPRFDFGMSDYCAYSSGCSERLTRYLLQNPPVGRGFNFYDWGGYLIGRGIPAKLFVDGRMHLWERQGYRPFLEHSRIYDWEDIKRFRDYRFDWVIAQTDSPLSRTLQSSNDQLGLGRWKKMFSDERGSYFVRVQ
ncbi:MAG: hypothetical protein HY695_20680 [Deltaproteobacteria bacterium]|nr:hypothetical protein [Deltaproteobacteria bacterium]